MSAPNTLSELTEQEIQKTQELAKDREIYNNFATPLVGTFLNLPKDAVVLTCPACGIRDLSVVQQDLKWWAAELNRVVGCLFVTFCCCCCFNYIVPFKQNDLSHYCKNCGCYFGRAMKHAAIKIKEKK